MEPTYRATLATPLEFPERDDPGYLPDTPESPPDPDEPDAPTYVDVPPN